MHLKWFNTTVYVLTLCNFTLKMTQIFDITTSHNSWTFSTLEHHALSFLANTVTCLFTSAAVYVCVCVCVRVCVCVCGRCPAACSNQDKGMPSHSRQRVCRLSEHADKLCRLMAHQTVRLSPDNARSSVQPQKKTKTKTKTTTQRRSERLYLKCRMWDVTQNF